MGKMIQTNEHSVNKKQRNREKQNARIGFLESRGNSGYDNRTDPNYCFAMFQRFKKEKAERERDQA